MSVPNLTNGGYSADIRMQLKVNGRTFVIGQLGPDFLILRQPANHPPAEAEITFSIDGRIRRWPVYLPDGISTAKPETLIMDCPSCNGSTVG